jgi:hypothetical protein
VKVATIEFLVVGFCSLDKQLKCGVRFSLSKVQNERAIYAFIVEGKVRYIGVCDNSNTTLRTRMALYQGMMGAGTNKRIVGYIRKELRTRRRVQIAAWKPDVSLEWKSLQVDFVEGLENPLIQAIRPK